MAGAQRDNQKLMYQAIYYCKTLAIFDKNWVKTREIDWKMHVVGCFASESMAQLHNMAYFALFFIQFLGK